MSELVVIGIDPGLKGGVAAIGTDNKPQAIPMPIIAGDVCLPDVLDWIGKASLIIIEHVHAFPVASKVANFKLGYGLGMLVAGLGVAGYSFQLIPAQEWRKVILKGFPKAPTPKERKQQAVLYCNRKWPYLKLKKTQDGLADAICLAEYGLLQAQVAP